MTTSVVCPKNHSKTNFKQSGLEILGLFPFFESYVRQPLLTRYLLSALQTDLRIVTILHGFSFMALRKAATSAKAVWAVSPLQICTQSRNLKRSFVLNG